MFNCKNTDDYAKYDKGYYTKLEQTMDPTFWLVAVFGLLWFLSDFSSLSNRGNSRRLERKIDLILKHLNIDPDQDVKPQIAELLKAGRKIQAIKLYRLHSGAGLKEAKDFIESL